MKRLLVLLAIFVVGATATACRPGTTPGTPESIYTWADGYAAVEAAFAPFGPEVLACAHAIAERESNHNPYALNGRHQGVFQLQPGFDGTIQNLAAAYGFPFASRFDPYLNALAARDAFLMYGTFSVNWPTTPGGCP